MKWKPALYAPRDATCLIVAIRFTCPCAKDGMTIITGGRLAGDWIFDNPPEHSFDITHFMELPKPPFGGTAFHHKEGHC